MQSGTNHLDASDLEQYRASQKFHTDFKLLDFLDGNMTTNLSPLVELD